MPAVVAEYTGYEWHCDECDEITWDLVSESEAQEAADYHNRYVHTDEDVD